jgi:hypothetical protein
MQGSRSRRIGAYALSLSLAVLILTACRGGGGSRFGLADPGRVDVKAACAELDSLRSSSDALNGVDVADPDAALAAVTKAVGAYSAALVRFQRVAPANLRAPAEAARSAVIARHFTQAEAARAPIDAWAERHCVS